MSVKYGGRHRCTAACPPLCKHATKGAGFGRPRAKQSTKGRTKRENDYMDKLFSCECDGCVNHGHGYKCPAEATECDHVEGRGLGGWHRDTSPLKGYCGPCHNAKHGIKRA